MSAPTPSDAVQEIMQLAVLLGEAGDEYPHVYSKLEAAVSKLAPVASVASPDVKAFVDALELPSETPHSRSEMRTFAAQAINAWNAELVDSSKNPKAIAPVASEPTRDEKASAWIYKWMVAEKYKKPDVPIWMAKARKHVQDMEDALDRAPVASEPDVAGCLILAHHFGSAIANREHAAGKDYAQTIVDARLAALEIAIERYGRAQKNAGLEAAAESVDADDPVTDQIAATIRGLKR